MTLKSMTGFARADGSAGPVAWAWEVRSVNGRGLDLRLRLPPGFEGLEPRVREAVAKRISRGSLTVNLNVRRPDGATEIRLNEAALAEVLAALERVRRTTGAAPPQAEALLGIRGVLEVVEKEESEAEVQTRTEAMLAGLGEALDGMVRARAAEGGRLRAVILSQIAAIEGLVGAIAKAAGRAPEAIRRRLSEQVARLMESGTSLDENRLHQEAALLATRADVEEELQRLTAHIAAARELVDSVEPAGRRLDFLAQEFNREANTLCSKASDPEMTQAGLELKAIIDQMREQVQNIE
jgi:uncharacterized protein (TIGR00255 family)